MANKIDILGAAAAIAKGMGVTLREMMSPTVTENYPDEPPKFEERYRGVHVLQRDDNGLEKCVACFLCAAACPSNCIYIEAAENTEQVRISRRRALRQGLQHRLQPLHLLRLLRGGLPHRRHHARPRLRGRQLQHVHAGQAQRGHAGAHAAGRQAAGGRPGRSARRTSAKSVHDAGRRLTLHLNEPACFRPSGNRSTPFSGKIRRPRAWSKSFSAIPASTPFCCTAWRTSCTGGECRCVPRVISQISRFFTGIEIHPGRHHRPALLHRSRHRAW